MKHSRSVGLFALLLGALGVASSAQAQQFVLVDETYTANSMNTMDSHFKIAPKAGIPADWTKPVNYAGGKAYVELQILEKPSDVPTLYNVCFMNSVNYSCMPYGPAYTATGPNPFNSAIMDFWQNDVMDWTKGVSEVQIVLKNMMEQKRQGDPQFYPMKAHVTISIVPPGGTYVKPTSGGQVGAGGRATPAGGSGGAGSGGTAAPRGGSGGRMATGGRSAPPPAGTAAPTGGINRGNAGGAGSGGRPAGSSGAPAAGMRSNEAPAAGSGNAGATGANNMVNVPTAGMRSITDELEDSTGCSTSRVHGARSGWFLLALAGLALLRKRRRGAPQY